MTKKGEFFLKVIIVSVIAVGADTIVGKLLHHFYARIRTGEQARMSYAVDSAKEGIIILGSSRASHHYVSKIMVTRLHFDCLNAGKDKQGIFYCLAMLKMVLQRNSPAYIILDITPNSFEKTENGLAALSVLLPYYNEHPEIADIINKRSAWERIKNCSALYRYNSLLVPIAAGSFSRGRDTAVVKGYIPLFRNARPTVGTDVFLERQDTAIDSSLVNAFLEMVAITASHKCKLIVVASPCFLLIRKPSSSIEKTRELCLSRQIPFLDYSQQSSFQGDTAIFADAGHLNDSGATIFTKMLCNSLLSKRIVEKPSPTSRK